MAKAFIQESTLTDIADAIRGKLGVSTQYLPSEMADAIESIPTGGGGAVEKKDVNFYDFDGTLVASYTKGEAIELETLPTPPTHTNLTFEGWNYTLRDMQSYVGDYGKLDIGAMYHTTDGRMHLIFEADADHLEASLNIGSTVSDAVWVDWGDGSEPERWIGTSVQRKTHTYSSAGVYDVGVSCESGRIVMSTYLCGNKTVQGVDGSTKSVIANYDSRYTHIYLPSSVTELGNNCFNCCSSLQSVMIPSSVTSLGSSCFYNCSSLQSVMIPSSVTSLGSNCFLSCSSLQSVMIPSSVTSLGSYCFQSCTSLQSVTIPSSVTSLGNYCFASCGILTQYHFKSATPPTITAANALTVGGGVTIYVPTSSLTDYQSANIWSTWATKMAEE